MQTANADKNIAFQGKNYKVIRCLGIISSLRDNQVEFKYFRILLFALCVTIASSDPNCERPYFTRC